MDPNAALAELRRLITAWQDARGPFSQADYDRAIELIADLDRWMTCGGFLPDQWGAVRRA
jgi:hypothetical protein